MKKKIENEQKPKVEIDFDEIQKGLISDYTTILSEKDRKLVLKTRAQTFAVEKKDETTNKEFIEVVVFKLASETYGIESTYIREVYPLKDFTTLPGVPSFVLGIINVRGQIISVIDLKKFFNLPEKGIGELNKVIIIRNKTMEFGVLADIIIGTQNILIENIHPLPDSTTGIGAEYLKGVTNEHIVILNAAKILGDEKIIIHQIIE